MPANWDAVQERKLLFAIIELTNPKPPSWQLVSEKMGPGYSNEACRQHYQKIKRESKNGSSAPSTPRKPSTANGKTATPKSTKSTGSKRKQAESFDSTMQDDDEEGFLASLKGSSSGDCVSVNGDGSPKKVKLEASLQDGPVCKVEEKTADGSVDLVEDS
ncbi:MAG: hypothetical protein M1830_000475 [Pleopsidium flavum]|nr:MAG: hypothetical protein M1830_000475 [Pleopsidium flavum]